MITPIAYKITKNKYGYEAYNKSSESLAQNNKGGKAMLKLLSKLAEKTAKNTNTACAFFWIFHQPKMPASLIKKD